MQARASPRICRISPSERVPSSSALVKVIILLYSANSWNTERHDTLQFPHRVLTKEARFFLCKNKIKEKPPSSEDGFFRLLSSRECL